MLSGRRFTGRIENPVSEVTAAENDSNYFKLLEVDGESLLVGARYVPMKLFESNAKKSL